MRRLVGALLTVLCAIALVLPWSAPPPSRAQAVDVYINITGGGTKKLNIAIPDFAVTAGTDTAAVGPMLASVAGADLTFSGLFSVVAATGSIPPDNPELLRKSWTDFAAAGAHAGVHGLLAVRGPRLEAEMRLYDLTTPDFRLIASRRFEMAADQPRRLAHKVADEIVRQFTGELGIADTKLAFVASAAGTRGVKEIQVADYDGAGARPLTRNGSLNLMPVWSPDTRSLAFTSYKAGYPDLYRTFPFERRPDQTLAAFVGINSSPAFSPDGRSLALTLSKDGNPEIYLLTLTTGAFRRLTRHPGIDTEPSWSPTGRDIAFVSDRAGGTAPHLFIMDAEGGNVRQLTFGGFHTQPRWSPKGDTIVYTTRQATHDLWAINPDGSNARRLTSGPGDNQGATWAPNGRHLAFQSNRLGRWQIFSMLVDGSEQAPIMRGAGEYTSPSWSPRLP
jgi:TolB protein